MPSYPDPFIMDGYIRRVRIHGVPNCYPPVDMEYRPMVGKEYTLFLALVYGGTDDTDRDILRQMEERILWWSFLPTTPTAENFKKLNGRLFDRILKVIMGSEAPDEDLAGNEPESDREMEATDAGN